MAICCPLVVILECMNRKLFQEINRDNTVMAFSPPFFFNKSNTIAMQYKVKIPLKSTLM